EGPGAARALQYDGSDAEQPRRPRRARQARDTQVAQGVREREDRSGVMSVSCDSRVVNRPVLTGVRVAASWRQSQITPSLKSGNLARFPIPRRNSWHTASKPSK